MHIVHGAVRPAGHLLSASVQTPYGGILCHLMICLPKFLLLRIRTAKALLVFDYSLYEFDKIICIFTHKTKKKSALAMNFIRLLAELYNFF